MRVVDVLAHQRDHRIEGNAYKFIQCDFAYNSNHIEGSTLTHDQTVSVYERGVVTGTVRVNDVQEAVNHFNLLDYTIDHVDDPLSASMLKRMHAILKRGTSDERDPLHAVGSFKVVENEIIGTVASTATCSPQEVPAAVDSLVGEYERGRLDDEDPLRTMARLHWRFETIHPFSDGNGRVGRMLLFKECLRRDVTPFIITEDIRDFYIRGLREFGREEGYLIDTFGFAQDRFVEQYLPLIERYEGRLRDLGLLGAAARDSRPSSRNESLSDTRTSSGVTQRRTGDCRDNRADRS